MKEQFFASANKLRAEYESKKKERTEIWQKTGAITAIESLSKALKDLQDIGINVRLQLNGNSSEDAFLLVGKASSPERKSVTVPISGVLKIDNTNYLLAISTSEDGENTLKIYISEFDYSGQGIYKNIRERLFDLQNDPKAIQNLQNYIIFYAARNEIIREHDVASSLGLEERRIFKLPKAKLDPL